jgi:hypothetical protein
MVYPSRVKGKADSNSPDLYYQLYLGGRQSTAPKAEGYISPSVRLNKGDYSFVVPESANLRPAQNINSNRFDPNFVFLNEEYKNHATLVYGLENIDSNGNITTIELNVNCEEGVVAAGDSRQNQGATNPFRNLAPRRTDEGGNRRHPDPADADFKAFKKEKKVRAGTDEIHKHNEHTNTIALYSKFGDAEYDL